MENLFLDANAHIPITEKTLKAYVDFCNSTAGHGHPLSPSLLGRQAATALEEARGKIANLIGAQSANQIIFTTSATEACNWAINLLLKNSNSFAISPVEHNAVSDAFWNNHFGTNIEIHKLLINSYGLVVDKREFDGVACVYVQPEIGTIQPIDLLNCKFLFSDMSQSLGKMAVDVSKLNVDVAAFGAHKFGGPSGVGFLYLKDTNYWSEFGTGSRYFMDISGTPNVSGIVATATALEEAVNSLQERTGHMIGFRATLEHGLKELGFKVIGEEAKRIPNTTFVQVPCEKINCGITLLMALGKFGIHVGLGSACGSMYAGGSPLMEALGRPSDGQDYIRISQWGNYGIKEAEYILDKIKTIYKDG